MINDEGKFNVPLENFPNIQYTFSDTNEWGQRSSEEIKRLLFLNEVMNLMYKMHVYINMVETSNLPLNQLIEYKQVEKDAPPDHEPEEDDINSLNNTIQDMSI